MVELQFESTATATCYNPILISDVIANKNTFRINLYIFSNIFQIYCMKTVNRSELRIMKKENVYFLWSYSQNINEINYKKVKVSHPSWSPSSDRTQSLYMQKPLTQSAKFILVGSLSRTAYSNTLYPSNVVFGNLIK